MQDRAKDISDQSVESKQGLADHFTESENEMINAIISSFDPNDDAKELQACQVKLALVEQENARLKDLLDKSSEHAPEGKSHPMFVHKQMIDLYRKMQLVDDENRALKSELNRLKSASESPVVEAEQSSSLLSPSPFGGSDEEASFLIAKMGLRRRFAARELESKPFLFSKRDAVKQQSQHNLDTEEQVTDQASGLSCIRACRGSDGCKIM